MSQHDYDIANQTAPNFRSDLNDALEAVVTNNSGSTEPSVTYANQWWYDTSNNILKIRSEADDAWINVGYLDQSTNEFKPYVGGTQVDTQSTATWEAGTSTTEGIVSPAKVKAAIDEYAIGIGQTWQDVSNSRSVGTTYQNTTGKAIAIAIYGVMNRFSGGLQASVDGSTWVNLGPAGEDGRSRAQTFGVIPVNGYYRVESGTVDTWSELR